MTAIEEFARQLRDDPAWPQDPAADLLRRIPARTSRGRPSLVFAEDDEPGRVGAITRSLRSSDDSSLEVQGPPESGKTSFRAHAIALAADDATGHRGPERLRGAAGLSERFIRAGATEARPQ